MVVESGRSARAGRPKAASEAQILQVAAQIADDGGLEAVSLRAIADRLGTSPMSVHRTTGGIDALRRELVATLVGDAIKAIDWPTGWSEICWTFARALRDLLMRHPLVLEAHRQRALEAPGADDIAHRMVQALRDAGLCEEEAVYAYATLHDFVTGHVSIRLGRGDFESATTSAERRAASVFVDHHDYDRRFETGISLLMSGIGAARAPRLCP